MKQQSSAKALDVEERFGRAIEQARDIIGEHERWCAEQVAAAEEAAQTDIARFGEASEELAQERRKLADLEEERERLPFEAFRANMDGNGEQLRTEIQRMIVRIITSEASRERMTEMLQNVHKDDAWPAIWAELDELEGQEGEGAS